MSTEGLPKDCKINTCDINKNRSHTDSFCLIRSHIIISIMTSCDFLYCNCIKYNGLWQQQTKSSHQCWKFIYSWPFILLHTGPKILNKDALPNSMCKYSTEITSVHVCKTEFTNVKECCNIFWSWGPSLFTCVRVGPLSLRFSLINVVPPANWPLPNREDQRKLWKYWSCTQSATPQHHMPIRFLLLHAALRVFSSSAFIISTQTQTIEQQRCTNELKVQQKGNCEFYSLCLVSNIVMPCTVKVSK